MSTRNRAAVKRRLVEIAKHVFRDEQVTVAYTLDVDPDDDAVFWVGETTGTLDPETIGSKPISTDEFSILVEVEAHGLDTGLDAEAEVERLLVLFETFLRSCDTGLYHRDLRTWDGAPDILRAPFHGIQAAFVAQVEGPRHSQPTEHGVSAWVGAEVACRTTITT